MYSQSIAKQIIKLINQKIYEQIKVNEVSKCVPNYTAKQIIQQVQTNCAVIDGNNAMLNGNVINGDFQPKQSKPQKKQQQKLQVIKQKFKNYESESSMNQSMLKSLQMNSSMRRSKLIMSLKKTRTKINQMNTSQQNAESVKSQKMEQSHQKFIKCIEQEDQQNISLKIAKQKKFAIERSLQQFKLKQARYIFEKQQKDDHYQQKMQKCKKYTFSYDGEFVEVNTNVNGANRIKKLQCNFSNIITQKFMRKTKTEPSIIQNAKLNARRQRLQTQQTQNQLTMKQASNKYSMLSHMEQKDIQYGIRIIDNTGLCRNKPRKIGSQVFSKCNKYQFEIMKQKRNKLYTETHANSLQRQKTIKIDPQFNNVKISIKSKKQKKINFLSSINSLQQTNSLNEKFPQQLTGINSTLATNLHVQNKKLPFITNFNSYLGSGRIKPLIKQKLQKIQINNNHFFEQLFNNDKTQSDI